MYYDQISFADALHQRFPQDKTLVDQMIRIGCPHWFFDTKHPAECDSCTQCWERRYSGEAEK